jgi:hypothetical protein
MNGKKYAILDGVLMCPLTVGSQALIFHQGQYIRTSTVVAIHGIDPEHVRFETKNTNYCLVKPSAPQSAYVPSYAMGVAA